MQKKFYAWSVIVTDTMRMSRVTHNGSEDDLGHVGVAETHGDKVGGAAARC